jgi:selenocysteine lyase/cysteine desulfurase
MLTATRQSAYDEPSLDPFFATLRAREFPQLDANGLAYLDYTGSALPAVRQLRAHDELLRNAVFGNPHAEHGPSLRSTEVLETARALLLAHLDADEVGYDVAFTANATAAVKLVGESYPFASSGVYALSADNHNSLNGIREYARSAGSRVAYLPLDAELRLSEAAARIEKLGGPRGARLFGFPAQSNFSGVRHPLELIGVAQRAGFDVLLDAAAYLPTSRLSLRTWQPEFVVLSFYKLFGLPTGLGALVARRDALARLRRPWFSGGTVEYVSVQNDRHSLLPGAHGFEDGTPHFLGVAAVPSGFALLAEVGMDRLSAHVARLTTMLLQGLLALQHADGAPMVRVYGPTDGRERGATVPFNVLARDGRVVPYWVVAERARALGVALRGGCFCNPGAAETAFGFEAAAAERCLGEGSAEGEFSLRRFAECMDRVGHTAVGAMRASLGMANDVGDVRRAVDVVRSFAD